jgi:hypothetical protein
MLRIAISAFFLMTTPMLATASKPASNGRCPVLGNPVANRNQSVAVRERNYFVCCSECGERLVADPDKFIDQDGRPKNATGSTGAERVRDRY